MITVVSPHLDDGVLSCGQRLVAEPGSTIITVLAAVPEGDLPLTIFDVNSGFTAADQAVLTRRREDRRACCVVDASPVHLNFWDRQYARLNETGEMIEAMVQQFRRQPPGVVYAPIGLGHPDHELVGRCARSAAKLVNADLVLYEELPYRVTVPESVPEGLDRVRAEGWTVKRFEGPQGDIAIKEAAVHCYRSQLWALDLHAALVPERFWALS